VFQIWKKAVLQQTSAQNIGRGQLPGRFRGDPEMKILMISIGDLNNG